MITKKALLAMAACILAISVFSLVMRSHVPDPAPTHWNIRGEADGYGPRWQLLFLMPAVTAGMIVLLAVLPILGPFRQNFERFSTTYNRICILLVVLLSAMHVVFVLKGAGSDLRIGGTLAVITGIMLALLGNWMGKVRRNFYLGIRTPWTLANDLVWERTHRVGGRLMMAWGLATAATGVFAPDWVCFAVVVGGGAALVLWAVLYSLHVYRRVGEADDLADSRG